MSEKNRGTPPMRIVASFYSVTLLLSVFLNPFLVRLRTSVTCFRIRCKYDLKFKDLMANKCDRSRRSDIAELKTDFWDFPLY